MTEHSLQELTEKRAALYKSGRKQSENDPLFWAWVEVHSLVRDDAWQGWEFVKLMLRQHDDEWVLENLAAGPLEDLLACHGDQLITSVETEARQNPRFRKLLGGVWQNAMSKELWARVQKAAGR